MNREAEPNPFVENDVWAGIRQEISDNLLQALGEKAEELGGEELKQQVLAASEAETGVVAPGGMMLLNNLKPGVAMEVLERANEINKESLVSDQTKEPDERHPDSFLPGEEDRRVFLRGAISPEDRIAQLWQKDQENHLGRG